MVSRSGRRCPHSIDASGPRLRKRTAERSAFRPKSRRSRASRSATSIRQFYSKQWSTAGQSRGLLSLQYQLGAFTGGAHPNTSYGALLWDRRLVRRNRCRRAVSRGRTLSRRLTRIAYCKALNDERRKRRQGEELERASSANARDMPSSPFHPWTRTRMAGSTRLHSSLLPTSRGRMPRESMSSVLPVTRQLIAAIKPEYRASFEAQRQ